MRAALGECNHEEATQVAHPADQPTLTTAADVFDETTGEWVPTSQAPRLRRACR